MWRYPQYSTIRELIWKLPESFLTVWFHEPRAEVDLGKVGPDGQADIELPDTVAGDWVALDNYRLGNDLVREKKGAETPAGLNREIVRQRSPHAAVRQRDDHPMRGISAFR